MLVQRGLGIPLFTHTDLLYRFLERTHQRFILAAFRPQDLLFHDGNVDHMKVIVVHVLPQRVGHGAVALVGVHDRRENVLLSAYDFYCGFVCVGVELFCEVIAAVIMKIGGVYVKDQLAVEKGILFQSAGGDDPILFHLLKHLRISSGRFLEMNIEPRSFRDNILIDIGSLFPFVVLLRVADSGSGQPHISCVGTVNTVASCHRQFTS